MPERMATDGGECSGEAHHRATSAPLSDDGSDRAPDKPAGAGIRVLNPRLTLAQCEQVLRQMGDQIRLGVDLGPRRDHISALHASVRDGYAEAAAHLATVGPLVTGDTPQAREMRALCARLHEAIVAGQAGLDAVLRRLQVPGMGAAGQLSDL